MQNDDDDDEAKKKKKSKKITVSDQLAKQMLEGDDGFKSGNNNFISHSAKQRALRDAFKKEVSSLTGDSDDSDDDDGFLSLRAKTDEEKKKEQEDYDTFAHSEEGKELHKTTLAKYVLPEGAVVKEGEAGDEINDDNFLAKYVMGQMWKEKDLSKLPSYKEIVGEEAPQSVNIDEDEGYLDEQDAFEAKYNFRYEEEGANEIMTYSRDQPDSVRAKTSKRAKQREARKLKKQQEKERKAQELMRLKNLKKQEIMKKLQEIQAITGTDNNELGGSTFELADLEADFDPEEYDKKMAQVFSEENFYNQEHEDDEESIRKMMEEDEEEAIAAMMKGEKAKPGQFLAEQEKKLSKAIRKKKTVDPSLLAAKEDINKKLEELYSMDFEDIIGGDIPCRFNYTSVPACDYGLSVGEILNSTDRELNSKVSLKRMAPYRPDAGDNTPWYKRRNNFNYALADNKRQFGEGDYSNSNSNNTGSDHNQRRYNNSNRSYNNNNGNRNNSYHRNNNRGGGRNGVSQGGLLQKIKAQPNGSKYTKQNKKRKQPSQLSSSSSSSSAPAQKLSASAKRRKRKQEAAARKK